MMDDKTFAINGRLVNPFAGMPRDEMDKLTTDFLDATQMEENMELTFRKGALLAQDSDAFRDGGTTDMSLTRSEEEALAREGPNGSKWHQPFILYALVACCSMGAAVQGWDESAINQAQIIRQYSLQLGLDDPRQGDGLPTTRFGLVNSAPYLCCAVLGCWLTDPLNHYLGRRGTIFVSCLISSVTCVGQGLTNTWQQLLVARLLLGLGIGPKSATIPVYAAESTPKQIRGALVMMWQMWTAFGIMLGYVSGVVFQGIKYSDGSPNDDLRWRLTIASPAVLPLVVCAYVFTLPESPRWLLAKAQRSTGDTKAKYYRKAYDSLCRLRNNKLLAARDMVLIYHSLRHEQQIRQETNRFVEMLSIPRNRRALLASSLVMFFQQFCGVNIHAYYSSQIFTTAGYSENKAQIASLGFGIINFLFAIPAFFTIDTFGRRNLLLVTFPLMAIFQLMTGMAFLAPSNTPGQIAVRKGIVTAGVYLFAASYSPGEGPVPFLYSSESMPLYVRDLGMSLFTATTWFFNFLLSITFPPFLRAFKESGTFGYYAAWCVVGFVLILLFVPETANQTLEELDARFSIPTRKHAMYGLRQLRWFFMRCILFRKAPKPKLDVPLEYPGSSSDTRPNFVAAASTTYERYYLGAGGNAPLLERKFPADVRWIETVP